MGSDLRWMEHNLDMEERARLRAEVARLKSERESDRQYLEEAADELGNALYKVNTLLQKWGK